ncbi:MAG: RagB/SusD family nutrient uptake outer membrane protein [Gemmatimonadales bacterium]
MTTTQFRTMAGAAALLFAAGCSDSHYNILNTNAPTVEQLTGAPNKAILGRAALGVAAGAAADVGGEISFYAIFGREGYNLLGNDPRLTQEMLRGPLEAGGFGGANFAGKYQTIRTINEYLKAIDAAADLTAAEKSASKGYAQTIKAVLFLRTIIRNGALGAPLAVEVGLDAPPAPFVNQVGVYTYIIAQLDEAKAALQAGGAAFPFGTPAGFESAATPADFLKFNRAVSAKAQVLRATLAGGGNAAYTAALTALNESFISRTGSLQAGVTYAYSTASGEPNNPISENLSAQRFYVHNSIVSGARLKGNGQPDDRFTAKVKLATGDAVNRTQGSLPLHNHKPATFNNVDGTADLGADIAIIRNEELILLAAEANWFAGSKQAAIDDINIIRTRSGGLAPTTLTTASPNADFVTELVYNRLYSLLWEQGTRWVDARRFGLKATLPNDRAGDLIHDTMLVPAAECDARGLSVPCAP